ncbi:MAG: serine/threonine protein kinase [Kofleriaceae bacterium]
MACGCHYLAMEWLKGETLRGRLARGPMTIAEISNVLQPLNRAIASAHRAGVVHRDLKPDNVFLVDVADRAPLVKLLDFGIAKLANNEHRICEINGGRILGTPRYISPEQATGADVDHRADIYSLGAIMFEMFTGRPPFMATTAIEVVHKHISERPVAPSTLTPGIPVAIDELIVRMLAKDPADRPTLDDVQRALNTLVPDAEPTSKPGAAEIHQRWS